MPTQTLLGSIDLFAQDMVLTLYAKGEVTRRFVTAGQLVRLLSEKAKGAGKWWFPSAGVVGVGVDGDGGQRYLLVRPSRRTPIVFEVGRRRRRLIATWPNLLVELQTASGRGKPRWQDVARVLAFAGRLRSSTVLYAAPFPNCYGEGGVCMGSVSMGRFRGLPAAEAFEKAWFGSTFTDHSLEGPLARPGRPYRNVVDLIRKTRGKIPLRALKRVGTYGKLYQDES